MAFFFLPGHYDRPIHNGKERKGKKADCIIHITRVFGAPILLGTEPRRNMNRLHRLTGQTILSPGNCRKATTACVQPVAMFGSELW